MGEFKFLQYERTGDLVRIAINRPAIARACRLEPASVIQAALRAPKPAGDRVIVKRVRRGAPRTP